MSAQPRRRTGRIDFATEGGHWGKCRYCRLEICFIWTGRAWMPLHPPTAIMWDGVERMEAHHAYCPKAPRRPRPGKRRARSVPRPPHEAQHVLFDG